MLQVVKSRPFPKIVPKIPKLCRSKDYDALIISSSEGLKRKPNSTMLLYIARHSRSWKVVLSTQWPGGFKSMVPA